MDKKQQRTFERDTTWQDARTQSIHAEFIGCLNTTIQTDRVHMSPHCCTMFAQGETHKRKSNQLGCPKSKKLTQFTSLWWGSKKPAQTVFSLLFFLTSHETLLYHWATCKENNTKARTNVLPVLHCGRIFTWFELTC